MDKIEKASLKGTQPLEIEEPINITIETKNEQENNREETEIKQEKGKRKATLKQIEQLKKAREAKAIKRKAMELYRSEVSDTDEDNTYSRKETDLSEYITPIVCTLGAVGGFFAFKSLLKKKNVEKKQEQSENYSQLQLNF